MIPPPPPSTLFPYTTLFRSCLVFPAICARDEGYDVIINTDASGGTSLEAHNAASIRIDDRSEEHTSELQSHSDLVCRLLLEKKKQKTMETIARFEITGPM